jgi:hypothetical protein
MSDEAPATKAASGWYDDPKLPNTKRYWAGNHWTEQRYELRPKGGTKPGPLDVLQRPGGMIVTSAFFAMLLGALASVVYAGDESLGVIALIVAGAVGSIGLQIGIIAKGVELGIRAARHRADLDF